MPPSQSGSRNDGLPSGSITLAIILILVIPSVLLVGLCLARKSPLWKKMRGPRPEELPRPRREKDPPAVAGEESLKFMPVVKYDQKLFTAHGEDPEACCPKVDDDAIKPTTEKPKNSWGRTARLILRSARISLGKLVSQRRPQEIPSHKSAPSQLSRSSLEITSGEAFAGKVAMQTCAVCTEDFVDGIEVRQLPCGHIFHPHCIDPWLLSFAATCPLW